MRAAVAVIAAAAIVAIAVCAVFVLLPSPQQQNEDSGSYYEIVKQDVTGRIFEEYLVMESGLVMKKYRDPETGAILVKLARIDAQAAREALANARSLAITADGNGLAKDVAEAPKPLGSPAAPLVLQPEYHLMFHAPNETGQLREGPSPLAALFRDTRDIFSNATREETRYVQAVWNTLDATNMLTADVHAFGDGVVVYEEFAVNTDDLITARVVHGNPSLLADLPGVLSGGNPDTSQCGVQRHPHAYLDIYSESVQGTVYTCGVGDTPADALYNALVAEVSK